MTEHDVLALQEFIDRRFGKIEEKVERNREQLERKTDERHAENVTMLGEVSSRLSVVEDRQSNLLTLVKWYLGLVLGTIGVTVAVLHFFGKL